MLASLNAIEKNKERFIEITADGVVSDEELMDFVKVQNELEKISAAVDSLQLWINKTIIDEGINRDRLEEIKKNLD